MKSLIVISVLCLQCARSFAVPESSGVGAFAFQDSSGNRYGGTYRLKDGQVVETKGEFPPNFQFNTFEDLDNFFPEYFRNLGNLLEEAFDANFESQRLAFNAARKAFDLTSNQAGYISNFNSRFPALNNFPNFGANTAVPLAFPAMPNFQNGFGAFASAMAGPGYSHQIAAINPQNPTMPNVNTVNQYPGSRTTAGNNGGYMSVSSSSYASSSNVNGEVQNTRGAETIVDNNGKVTKYKVQS